jgi:hypothetical protein
MAESTSKTRSTSSATTADDAVTVERQDTTVETVSDDSSKKELEANLTFKEDAELHPVGAPPAPDDKPGGPPAVDPERPPVSSNRPDTPLITSLATGSGQHTPPDPSTVDADGYVRPHKAAEENANR